MSTTKRAPRITGDATAAAQWIADSPLPEAQKRALLHFVQRFPGLRFYKQERPAPNPAWLRALGTTLISVAPGELCWFRFPHLDQPTAHGAGRPGAWYHRLAFVADVTAEYDQIFLDGTPLLFVAALLDDLDSLLAVRDDPAADARVYMFSYRAVAPSGERQGRVALGDAAVAFESYASMLSQIGAVKLESGEIITALGDRA